MDISNVSCVLREQDSQGLPRIERDIPQLEQFSQKLRARTQRIDNSADQIAATRLLAQEGFNAQRCYFIL